MSKAKSITELVTELQQRNEELERLDKLANQWTKAEFGFSVKDLHRELQKVPALERKVRELQQARQGQQPPKFAKQNGAAARGGQEPLPDRQFGDPAGEDVPQQRVREQP